MGLHRAIVLIRTDHLTLETAVEIVQIVRRHIQLQAGVVILMVVPGLQASLQEAVDLLVQVILVQVLLLDRVLQDPPDLVADN